MYRYEESRHVLLADLFVLTMSTYHDAYAYDKEAKCLIYPTHWMTW